MFSDCHSLVSVDIPSGVVRIGEWAFFKCLSLKEAAVPEGVESVGGGAFSDCMSLSRVSLPSSLESLGGSAFFGLDFLDVDGEGLAHTPECLGGRDFQGSDGVLRQVGQARRVFRFG